jgi:hypothetical protein
MIAERLRPQKVAYEIGFDRKIGLKEAYLSKQIDTYIGERLNVLLSKTKYEIKNNLLYGEDVDEPFINVIKRGVDYKEENEGKDRIDRKREEAEIQGFQKIQKIMLNPNTEIGTMVLSVSPKGGEESTYQRNFYDIFTLKEACGKRFIESRRYSSALAIDEYKDKLKPLASMENIFDAGDFLKNPIKIDNVFFESADQVHAYLHKNHKVVEFNRFEDIKRNKDYEDLKQRYYQAPDPKILDAIKNLADEKAGLIPKIFFSQKPSIFYDPIVGSNISLTMDQKIDLYGNQKVRQVATGCGSSGSSSKDKFNNSLNISSPFSVAEFGLNDEGIDYDFDQSGPCKKCSADVMCGPCGICKACDLAIRANNKNKLN